MIKILHGPKASEYIQIRPFGSVPLALGDERIDLDQPALLPSACRLRRICCFWRCVGGARGEERCIRKHLCGGGGMV